MARHASRHTRMRDRMTVRVERELLLVDRDDHGEHAIGLSGEVIAFRLCRSLVPGGERRAFRLRWTPGLGLPHWLLIERQRLGRGGEANKQGGARCHDQKRFAVARIDGMAARPMGLLHEGPPWCFVYAQRISRTGIAKGSTDENSEVHINPNEFRPE